MLFRSIINIINNNDDIKIIDKDTGEIESEKINSFFEDMKLNRFLDEDLNKTEEGINISEIMEKFQLDNKKYTTIDYLEQEGKLRENVNDNLYSPLLLARLCEKHNIHFTYIGTGCIFEYDENHPFGSNNNMGNPFLNPFFTSNSPFTPQQNTFQQPLFQTHHTTVPNLGQSQMFMKKSEILVNDCKAKICINVEPLFAPSVLPSNIFNELSL